MKKVKLVSVEEGTTVTIPGMTGEWRRLIKPEDTEEKVVMGVGCLNQGEGRGWHTHPQGEEEVLYIVKGEGLVEWKENKGKVSKAEAKAGTAIYTPDGIENNLSNPYSEVMNCVFFIRLKT